MKRAIAIILTLCMTFIIASCAPSDKDQDNSDVTPTKRPTTGIVGMIAIDDGETDTYVAMHSFLSMAQELGMDARLYRGKSKDELSALANKAESEGCEGVIVHENASTDEVYSILNKSNVITMSFLTKKGTASTVIDDSKYVGDIALVLAGAAKENGNESGKLLICASSNGDDYKAMFEAELKAQGYNYTVAVTKASTKDEIKLELTDVVGLWCADGDKTEAAVQAADVNKIVVIGTGLTDKNAALYDKGMYGLSIVPISDAAFQATRQLVKLINGEKTDTDIIIYRHIVKRDAIKKHMATVEKALSMF